MYHVYIIECADKSFYTGITNNLETRIAQHQNGEDRSAYTFKRRPVKLVAVETFQFIWDAIEREKQIKGWSRKKKMALITGQYESLPELSKRGPA